VEVSHHRVLISVVMKMMMMMLQGAKTMMNMAVGKNSYSPRYISMFFKAWIKVD
jgi:hypothetical protein